MPVDCDGMQVELGSRVRILSLSGEWFDALPDEERLEVASMIGQVFEVEDIDEYGQPWVSKSWPDPREDRWHGHAVALESYEMQLVLDPPGSSQ
ncbi:MAG: hypothetical protein IPK27_19965 [Rhodanobacteraceae bacterium]|nr:hypothetical protein [Rhodanobacteraceae bacterium]